MGLIKEPLDVDFVVDPRPLTIVEEKAISEFIRADKEKRKQKAFTIAITIASKYCSLSLERGHEHELDHALVNRTKRPIQNIHII